jgi:hypothetical protein
MSSGLALTPKIQPDRQPPDMRHSAPCAITMPTYKSDPRDAQTSGGLAQEVLAPMQQERTGRTAQDDDHMDWSVLVTLMASSDSWPWSVDELAREHGDGIAAIDAVDRLARIGLLHRTRDGLVFPTRAALHYTEIRA